MPSYNQKQSSKSDEDQAANNALLSSAAVLSIAYLPPIQWYTKFVVHSVVMLDQFEYYSRQTWRNRCQIGGPNNVQNLSIPVTLPFAKTRMHEVRMDTHERWQQQHWRSIKTAYGKSAFFEFYADHFHPFYTEKLPDFLIEWTLPLVDLCLKLLKLDYSSGTTGYALTTDYVEQTADKDYRLLISPKNNNQADSAFHSYAYPQVFSDRFGFRPNLSCIDLLCCCGPQAGAILKQSVGNES